MTSLWLEKKKAVSLIVLQSGTCSVNLTVLIPLYPSPVHFHLKQGCESYLKPQSSCQAQTGSMKYTENHFLWLLTGEQVVCGVVETDTSPTPAALNESQIHKRHGGQIWSGLWTTTLETSHLKKTPPTPHPPSFGRLCLGITAPQIQVQSSTVAFQAWETCPCLLL